LFYHFLVGLYAYILIPLADFVNEPLSAPDVERYDGANPIDKIGRNQFGASRDTHRFTTALAVPDHA
jgi:hypothetical protein